MVAYDRRIAKHRIQGFHDEPLQSRCAWRTFNFYVAPALPVGRLPVVQPILRTASTSRRSVNQVASKRTVKKQQMQWSEAADEGAEAGFF